MNPRTDDWPSHLDGKLGIKWRYERWYYRAEPDLPRSPRVGVKRNGATPDTAHTFRAVMGLYFRMCILWLLGAFKPDMTRTALWSLVIFMLGLAAGRLLSLIVDGPAHWLLIVYLLLELVFGAAGLWFLKQEPQRS